MIVTSPSAMSTRRPVAGRPFGQCARQRCGATRDDRFTARLRNVECERQLIGERLDASHRVSDDLLAVLEHLHGGADADGEHEGDNEHWNGAPQERLGAQQPPISGIGD